MKLSDIIVPERQRQLYEDIPALAASITRFGLLEPLLLAPTKELVAGGRRLAAIRLLGLEEIPEDWVRFTDTLDEATRLEMEFEENARRSDITWQEKVLAIERIHTVRSQAAALSGETWLQEQTGQIVGLAQSNVAVALKLAKYIRNKDTEICEAASAKDGLRILLQRTDDAAQKLLAAKLQPSGIIPASISALAGELDDTVSATVTAPAVESEYSRLNLSSFCHHCDAFDFLRRTRSESIDHIYTDPPYAIDMDNLQQAGSGMDVSRVRDTHQVEANKTLLERFLAEAFRILKPTGFCIFWYDDDLSYLLHHSADTLGFVRQRWPLVWIKPQAMNQMAHCNWTKATEVVMVLRKPQAKLQKTQPVNWYACPNDKALCEAVHPFWKPIVIHQWILNAFAIPGDVILDPFAGEGSIPYAALTMGLEAIAVECEELHYNRMLNRLSPLCRPKNESPPSNGVVTITKSSTLPPAQS